MGQKVHPGGLRVGVIHDWKSNWMVGKKEFAGALLEDIKIREHILRKLSHAGLSDILIRKDKQRITIDIYTARPGIVIGKSGVEVDALRKEVHAMTQKNVHININEIKRPELDAKLVAQSIAEQLQNRVSFRRAMKRSLASAIRSGAAGVKVQCSGRLGGSEMSRSEQYSEGRVPLHTIRADIDYGFAEAKTPTGRIGVKVWINKGEIMPAGYGGVPAAARRRASATRTRRAAAAASPRASAPRARPAATATRTARASAPCAAAVPASAAAGPSRRRRPAQPPRAAARAAAPAADAERRRADAPRRRRAGGASSRSVEPQVEASHAAGGRARRARPPAETPTPSGTATKPAEPATRRRAKPMLLPKKTKFRKMHRGRRRGEAKGQSTVQFGDYGIKALENGWITNRQIEAARIAMTRKIKRGGKVWINVFPDKPFTKKPAETRMGKGKGSPEGWVAVIKPGRVMFELAGVPEPLAKEALRLAGQKLPIKTKFVRREGGDLFAG